MKSTIKSELPALGLVALPFLYLAYIWNKLPEKVPLHWNSQGEIDRYGSKVELLLIPILLPALIYFIFLLVPRLDPKGQLNKMGNKYHQLKMGMVMVMSALAMIILYLTLNPETGKPNLILLPIGVLFAILGNYMKTLKWNYFIGIRTPWTLENNTVWKDTHRLGGMAFLAIGFLIILSSLLLDFQWAIIIVLVGTLGITFGLVLYSYLRFQRIQKGEL